jgi:Tfp pilus assembly protein PilV
MKINKLKNNTGFTIVEAMFAVFLLTVSVTSLMSIVASSLFSAKYSRDQITATYLAQEAVDYIRNDRDTSILRGTTFASFSSKYNKCIKPNGCSFDVLDFNGTVKECGAGSSGSIGCPYLYYNQNPNDRDLFYSSSNSYLKTNFKRQILVEDLSNELKISVKVEWMNGGAIKSIVLNSSLLNWLGL